MNEHNAVPTGSSHVLDWMRTGEARFIEALDGLTDDELREDSALSDWSRAHVAGHVARNAEAVSRLLSWARTGKENLMYPDVETRNHDIEASARREPDALRADVRDSARRFTADVDALPSQAWSARVRTFQGRDVPATFVLWMRVREVWLHLVDLDAGAAVESWPGELVDALLDEVTATMSGREDAPAWLLPATDRDRTWHVGPARAPEADGGREISGRAADLLAWLTGRSSGEGLATEGVLPDVPPWM